MPDDTPSQGKRGDEPTLPTLKELQQLPRWAVVAYAVRCAQRVRPLFEHHWRDAPREHIETVDRAIKLAQASAANPTSARAGNLKEAEAAAEDIAERAVNASFYAALAATFAAGAAGSAFAASDTALVEDADHAASAANSATEFAAEDDADIDPKAAHYAIFNATRADYELLRVLSHRKGWTDASPVSPALLGPVWLDGEPEGWPKDRDVPSGFRLAIDPGNADTETLQEVLSALSDLHAAHTGHELLYRLDGALVHAEAKVCV